MSRSVGFERQRLGGLLQREHALERMQKMIRSLQRLGRGLRIGFGAGIIGLEARVFGAAQRARQFTIDLSRLDRILTERRDEFLVGRGKSILGDSRAQQSGPRDVKHRVVGPIDRSIEITVLQIEPCTAKRSMAFAREVANQGPGSHGLTGSSEQ